MSEEKDSSAPTSALTERVCTTCTVCEAVVRSWLIFKSLIIKGDVPHDKAYLRLLQLPGTDHEFDLNLESEGDGKYRDWSRAPAA